MRKAVAFLGAAAAAVGVWACSDIREPSTPLEVDPSFARPGAACDLSATLDAARRYLNSPQQQEVTAKLSTIQTNGCTGLANEQLAWEVLKTVETVADAAAGNEAQYGAALVTGLLDCCIPKNKSFTLANAVLGAGGLFGVRGGAPGTVADTAWVVSRDPVTLRLTAEDTVQTVDREAVFVLRPRDGSWANIAAGLGNPDSTHTDQTLLLTGFPVGVSPHTSYQLDEAPDLGFQTGSQVDIIVCFVDDLNDPANADPHSSQSEGDHQLRMKRNGSVVLQPVANTEAICGPIRTQLGAQVSTAQTVMTALVDMATDVLMPEPLGAMFFTDTRTPSFGGGGLFFSQFSGKTALENGTLEFKTPPPSVVQGINTPFTVEVRAKTGGGAPLELVEITLTATNNNGVPGGLVGTFRGCTGSQVSAPALGCTQEQLNADAFASITTGISSAGGYNFCATGTAADFTFVQVCKKINVRR